MRHTKNSRFYIYNQIFTQELISKETVYKFLTLEWKITMSLSYYIAYDEKKKEKNRYTKYYNLNFTEKKNKWPYLSKILI